MLVLFIWHLLAVVELGLGNIHGQLVDTFDGFN